jgi:hypothetical protein
MFSVGRGGNTSGRGNAGGRGGRGGNADSSDDESAPSRQPARPNGGRPSLADMSAGLFGPGGGGGKPMQKSPPRNTCTRTD